LIVETKSVVTLSKSTSVIRPRPALDVRDLTEIWEYRELLYFLVWRDVKVRYKQTAIGVGWALLQPLMAMLAFTVVFSGFAQMPSGGSPYPLFVFIGLMPWTYFSQAVIRSTSSLVGESSVIKKVHFPRVIVPLAAAIAPLIDLGLSLVALFGLMVWFGVGPTWSLAFLPGFTVLAVASAVGVGLWLSALNARYRDIGHAVPFLTQFWLFASPVAYPASVVPEKWRLLFGLNPVVGVIEGFRWAVLGGVSPDWGVVGISTLIVIALVGSGLAFFIRTQRVLADIL
jgi:lipopolysaccharide transport system permease protein